MNASTKLPPPRHDGGVSIERALSDRRSVRSYRPEPLGISEVSQLLWAAQGLTGAQRYRTAPSAGALFPLEIYVAAGAVTDLESGIYRYDPQGHRILLTATGDQRPALCRSALSQGSIRCAPAVLVFCAVFERATGKYGRRGVQYVHMEAGHAVENACLQAVSLGLGAVVIGAFDDGEVGRIVRLPPAEAPLLLLPIGKPASGAEEEEGKF